MNKNNKLIDGFLETIYAERNASKNTLLAYKRDLVAFTNFLSKKNIDLYKTNRKDIENYIISLDNNGMSEATRARHLSTIKQIYRYGYEESIIKENPSTDIKGPKSKRKLPNNLSEEDINRLLASSSQIGRSPKDKRRNTCLMHLLYATGMRVSELVSLPVVAVRGNPEMILVKGKGGKERLVPLSSPAKMAIAAYLVDWNIKQKTNKKKGLTIPEQLKEEDGDWLVPVVSGVNIESEKDALAYLVADNRLVELGGWNAPELSEIIHPFSDRYPRLSPSFKILYLEYRVSQGSFPLMSAARHHR